jgi:hypothetical protein
MALSALWHYFSTLVHYGRSNSGMSSSDHPSAGFSIGGGDNLPAFSQGPAGLGDYASP